MVCVGVPFKCGYGGVVSYCSLKHYSYNKISGIKLVSLYSTIKMMHGPINIRFQGDSLSPLLFCICLIPLTKQLNRLNTGYEEHATKTKISYLLYMEDLKLIAKLEEELQKHIQIVKTFSDDIHTEFGLEKGARIAFKGGKVVQ